MVSKSMMFRNAIITSAFLVDRSCSFGLLLRFLPVSPMWEAWQSEYLIL